MTKKFDDIKSHIFHKQPGKSKNRIVSLLGDQQKSDNIFIEKWIRFPKTMKLFLPSHIFLRN